MKIRIILFLIISVSAITLNAQEVLTPEGAVARALENNFSIRISKNEALISENNVTIGNAGFLPDVNVTASQTYSNLNTEQTFLTGETREVDGAKAKSLNANAGLNWVVFDGLGMFASYKQLEFISDRSSLQLLAQIENTVLNVLETYYQIVAYQQNISAIEEALVYSTDILELSRQKKEIGAGSGLEVLQAEVNYNNDMAALIDQQELVQNAKILLNQLMVMPATSDFTVVDTLHIEKGLDYAALLQKTINANTEVLISRKNRQIAYQDLKLITSEQYPQVALNLGYGYTNASAESGFLLSNQSNGWQYGISAYFNIFNGFNISRRKENAKILIQNAELSEKAIVNDLQSSLAIAFNIYSNNIKKLELEQNNLTAARRTLEIIMERNRLGDIAGIEMREAQQNFLFAQNRFITAQFLAKMAELDLLRISGQLVNQK